MIRKNGIYLKEEIEYDDSDDTEFIGELFESRCKCYVGNIGVDSGLAGFFEDKPDYNDTEWHEFVEELEDENGELRRYQIRPEGFFTESGYGDGSYPVCAFKNKHGDIIGLEIDFDDGYDY